MFGQPFIPFDNLPTEWFPSGVFEYYATHVYTNECEQSGFLETREDLLDALNSNSEFQKFWSSIIEGYSKDIGKLTSLTNKTVPFDNTTIKIEFQKFLQIKGFENMSSCEKEELETKYAQMRRARHLRWSRKWGYRVGFHSAEAIGQAPIQLYDYSKGTLRLEALEDDVLLKIVNSLGVYDIFKMTLVCKEWKKLIYRFAQMFKKAEYPLLSYFLDYADFKFDLVNVDSKNIKAEYEAFSVNLLTWYSRISSNLETLIIHQPMHHFDLLVLLQNCPNLKHLQIERHGETTWIAPLIGVPDPVDLLKLEVLLCRGYRGSDANSTMRDIVKRAKNLRALQCSVFPTDWNICKPIYCLPKLLANLTVLDFADYTLEVVRELAQVEEFQLRYFRLGTYVFTDTMNRMASFLVKIKEYFSTMLSKMKKLEVLVTSYRPGVSRSTINLITELQMNLQFAVLRETSHVLVRNAEGNIDFKNEETLDLQTLMSFREALLLHNPNRTLSDIVFIIDSQVHREELQSMDLGFTFLQDFGLQSDLFCRRNTLKDPAMLKYLNLAH